MVKLLVTDAEIERRVLSMPQVTRRVDDLLDEIENEARDLGRQRAFDSGQFAEVSIRRVPEPGPRRRVRAVGTGRRGGDKPMLPRWLEEGTGIYGPRRQPIRPKKGQFLVFPVKARDRAAVGSRTYELNPNRPVAWVRVREVAGRPGSHVMRDAGQRVADRHRLRWVPSR